MSKSHSRRAVLAGTAAASAIAVPALAAAEPDPIYAAIERYKDSSWGAHGGAERNLGLLRGAPPCTPSRGSARNRRLVAAEGQQWPWKGCQLIIEGLRLIAPDRRREIVEAAMQGIEKLERRTAAPVA
jgi:hypothetical protein